MTTTSLLSALDSTVHNLSYMDLDSTNMEFGENNHPQYSWSTSIPEKIVQFSFQLTENGGQNWNLLFELRKEYVSLLKKIFDDDTLYKILNCITRKGFTKFFQFISIF